MFCLGTEKVHFHSDDLFDAHSRGLPDAINVVQTSRNLEPGIRVPSLRKPDVAFILQRLGAQLIVLLTQRNL